MEHLDLNDIRRTAARLLTGWLWVHPLLILAAGALPGGHDGRLVAGIAAALCVAATLVVRRDPAGLPARATLAVSYVLMISALVLTVEPMLQIDLHMYYFAALAMLASFCCWRTLVLAAGVTAVHHLVLNFVFPLAVFPDGASFVRVLLHAVIVVLETAMLVWLSATLARAMSVARQALSEASSNLETAQAAEQEQHRLRVEHANVMERRQAEEAEAAQRQLAHERLTMEEASSARRLARQEAAERFEGTAQRVIAQLHALVTQALASAERVRSVVGGVHAKSDSVTASATQTAGSVNMLASATEELNASFRNIGEQVAHSSQIAALAAARAGESDSAMTQLNDAAQKIGEIVAVIQGIADQTNLLALNATIEAARAGEAGRGFAVVASEVKLLANQTAKATEEVSAHIGAIQGRVGHSADAIASIRATIEQVNDIASHIEGAIGEQQSASADIAVNIQRASDATQAVCLDITSVSEAVTSCQTEATTLNEVMRALVEGVDQLGQEMGQIAHTLRAA